MAKGHEGEAQAPVSGTARSNPVRRHPPRLGPQDVPTFEDANSVHLLGNMKEGGLNNPPLSPRLCVTTHPAPVLKFLARVNA